MELHPDELPHVLVHQADAGAVDDVPDVGRNPAATAAAAAAAVKNSSRPSAPPLPPPPRQPLSL